MAEKSKQKQSSKAEDATRGAAAKKEKLSLYPLSIEEALRAAAKTGRPPKSAPAKPRRPAEKSVNETRS
jgi:hypothetical protein